MKDKKTHRYHKTLISMVCLGSLLSHSALATVPVEILADTKQYRGFEHWYSWYMGHEHRLSWYAGVGAGFTLAKTKGDTLTVSGFDEYARTTKAGNNANVSLIGGLRYQRAAKNVAPWFNNIRVGLRYQNQLAQKLTGRAEWHDVPESEDMYDYTYTAQTQMLLFEGALAIYNWQYVAPYLHAGFGIAQIQSGTYQQTPGSDSPGITDPYGFKNHTNYDAVGVYGVGITYNVNSHWVADLSYDFYTPLTASLGDGPLSPNSSINATGISSKITNQAINLTMRYNF